MCIFVEICKSPNIKSNNVLQIKKVFSGLPKSRAFMLGPVACVYRHNQPFHDANALNVRGKPYCAATTHLNLGRVLRNFLVTEVEMLLRLWSCILKTITFRNLSSKSFGNATFLTIYEFSPWIFKNFSYNKLKFCLLTNT